MIEASWERDPKMIYNRITKKDPEFVQVITR